MQDSVTTFNLLCMIFQQQVYQLLSKNIRLSFLSDIWEFVFLPHSVSSLYSSKLLFCRNSAILFPCFEKFIFLLTKLNFLWFLQNLISFGLYKIKCICFLSPSLYKDKHWSRASLPISLVENRKAFFFFSLKCIDN